MAEHLIEYQLHMVGKTMEDAKEDPMWFFNITMTQAQYLEFKKYALFQIKKTFKCNKKNAERTFEWFNLEFGLRVVPTQEERENIINQLKKEQLWEQSTSQAIPKAKT